MKSLAREGIPIDNISDEHLDELFRCLEKGIVAKEAIPEVLSYIAKHPETKVEDAINKLGLRSLSVEELDAIIDKIIEENIEAINLKERSWKLIMGKVMKLVRGKIDGRIVAERVQHKVQEVLKSKK